MQHSGTGAAQGTMNILPETGRGTIQRMVEGHPANSVMYRGPFPSLSPCGLPPPRFGEELS
jgi:hypothetical protein